MNLEIQLNLKPVLFPLEISKFRGRTLILYFLPSRISHWFYLHFSRGFRKVGEHVTLTLSVDAIEIFLFDIRIMSQPNSKAILCTGFSNYCMDFVKVLFNGFKIYRKFSYSICATKTFNLTTEFSYNTLTRQLFLILAYGDDLVFLSNTRVQLNREIDQLLKYVEGTSESLHW